MNSVMICTPGKAGLDIEISATDRELEELYQFLSHVEYELFDNGPEWLIDIYETLEEKYAW